MIKTDMRFDTRTLDHRLRRGEITKKELEEHLDRVGERLRGTHRHHGVGHDLVGTHDGHVVPTRAAT